HVGLFLIGIVQNPVTIGREVCQPATVFLCSDESRLLTRQVNPANLIPTITKRGVDQALIIGEPDRLGINPLILSDLIRLSSLRRDNPQIGPASLKVGVRDLTVR